MNLLIIPNPVQAAEQEALPMDFLEFLGEGIVSEDEYLDPLNYADIEQGDAVLNNKHDRLNSPFGLKNEEVKNNEK